MTDPIDPIDPIETPGPLTFVDTNDLVDELLKRDQAVVIGIVREDEDVPNGCLKVLYRTSGEPTLQLCCVRDLRFLTIDKALESGLAVERIEEIFGMYGHPSDEPADGTSDGD